VLSEDPAHYVIDGSPEATVTIEDNEKWGLEALLEPCLCDCPGVEIRVVEQLGMLVVQVADGARFMRMNRILQRLHLRSETAIAGR